MISEPKFWKQWFVIVAVLITIAVVVYLGFPQFYDTFAVQVWKPKLEKQLGFKAITGQHKVYKEGRVFYISQVSKGGLFESAGVRPGYIPFGYKHGFEKRFYSQLESYRGELVTLLFLEISPNGEHIEHRIKIDVPK